MQESAMSKASDAMANIQDAYMIRKSQIAGSPFTTARQLKKELTRTVTRHMTTKAQEEVPKLNQEKEKINGLHIDLKKQLHTA